MPKLTKEAIAQNILTNMKLADQVGLAKLGISWEASNIDKADGKADGSTNLGKIAEFLSKRIASTKGPNPTEMAFLVALEGEDPNHIVTIEQAKKLLPQLLNKLDSNKNKEITCDEVIGYLSSPNTVIPKTTGQARS